MRLLVTGSNGLVGAAVVRYFSARGWKVHGVDNNLRAEFFGPGGDTRWNQQRLERECRGFSHHEVDIRDREAVLTTLRAVRAQAIVQHRDGQCLTGFSVMLSARSVGGKRQAQIVRSVDESI